MQNKNLGIPIGIGVILLIGFVAFPHVRWFQVRLKVDGALADKGGIGRFPSREQIVTLKPTVLKIATEKGFESPTAQLELEYRVIGPVRFWYLKVTVSSGAKTLKLERRIESPIDKADLEWFAEQGVTVPIRKDEDEED